MKRCCWSYYLICTNDTSVAVRMKQCPRQSGVTKSRLFSDLLDGIV